MADRRILFSFFLFLLSSVKEHKSLAAVAVGLLCFFSLYSPLLAIGTATVTNIQDWPA